jgi:hypothetical protein
MQSHTWGAGGSFFAQGREVVEYREADIREIVAIGILGRWVTEIG